MLKCRCYHIIYSERSFTHHNFQQVLLQPPTVDVDRYDFLEMIKQKEAELKWLREEVKRLTPVEQKTIKVGGEKSQDLDEKASDDESELLRCEECSATYKNYSSLKKHYLKYHLGKIPQKKGNYKCDICGKTYREKQVLLTHVKGVHTEKPRCDICGKSQSNLARHKKSCLQKKKGRGKKFSNVQEDEQDREEQPENDEQHENKEGQQENEAEQKEQEPEEELEQAEADFGVNFVQYEKDLELAMLRSRADNPEILPASEVKQVAVNMARGIGLKTKAAVQNIDMDGNCLPTAITVSTNPDLTGENLRNDAWELRVKSIGIAAEMVATMEPKLMQQLQDIAAGEAEIVFTKEDLKNMLQAYQQNGTWNGGLGDVIVSIMA